MLIPRTIIPGGVKNTFKPNAPTDCRIENSPPAAIYPP